MTEKTKNTRKYEPAVHESIDKYLAAIRYLTEHKMPFSDKTPFGGALWVFISDPESKQVADLAATSGLKFNFSKKGGAASHNTPAWYYRPSGKAGDSAQDSPTDAQCMNASAAKDEKCYVAKEDRDWIWNSVDESRVKNAHSISSTSFHIDAERKTAVFESSPLRKTGEIIDYIVSLTSCSCNDFHNNLHGQKPCKHIIRLAMELGIINENGVTLEQQLEIDISALKEKIAVAYGMYYHFHSSTLSDEEYDDMKHNLAQLERKAR